MSDEPTNFDRIETTDDKPGIDTATIRKGDILELASGEPGNEGARFRVVDNDHMGGLGGDGGSLNVEPIGETNSRRDTIVDNGTGPMFNPVKEA